MGVGGVACRCPGKKEDHALSLQVPVRLAEELGYSDI